MMYKTTEMSGDGYRPTVKYPDLLNAYSRALALGAMSDARASNVDMDSPHYEAKPARARVTNHNDLLPGVDGRSAGARRYRDLAGR